MYRLRVVSHNTTTSRVVTATEYIARDLMANTRYTVYVSAGSFGVYGPEVSTVNTTGKSECCINLSCPYCACMYSLIYWSFTSILFLLIQNDSERIIGTILYNPCIHLTSLCHFIYFIYYNSKINVELMLRKME